MNANNTRLVYETQETAAVVLPNIQRECRCGGIATPISTQQSCSGIDATMWCKSCGRKFSAHAGRLEVWQLGQENKIAYFQRRKEWARKLLKKAGLESPGDSLTATFEDDEFEITIGPRKGVRIKETTPYE